MCSFIKKQSLKAQEDNINRSIERILLIADATEKGILNDQSINEILKRLDSIQSDFIGPMSQREIRTTCFDPILSKNCSYFKKELLLYALYSGKLQNEFRLDDINLLDEIENESSIESLPTSFFNGLLLDCFKSALQLNGFNSFNRINNETVQLAYLAAKKTFQQKSNGVIFPSLGVINFIALKYIVLLEQHGFNHLEAKIKEDYADFKITKSIPKEYLLKELLLKDYTYYNFDKYEFFNKYN